MNPLLRPFNTPYTTVPFTIIKPEHFTPAFEVALKEAHKKLDSIINSSKKATFLNTIVALEEVTDKIDLLAGILFNLNHAETNEAIQKLARETAPKLSEFSNDITLNPILWSRIRAVFNSSSKTSLSTEEYMLLEKTYKGFVRSGAKLDDKAKQQFRSITKELSALTIHFGENVLAETNNYYLHLTNIEQVSGLPEDILQAAATEAENRKVKGWIFTLQFPSFVPFMKYADNRELRKEIYIAFNTRCLQGNKFDNQKIIKRIAFLRLQIANLLGFPNYAAFVLDNRMAETPAKVYSFLNELKKAYLPMAIEEVNEVKEFAKKNNLEGDLQGWDWNYYSEKLKKTKFDIDDELTRPYFELYRIQNEVFRLANELYGISFKEKFEIPLYNKEVKTYEVIDEEGKFLAVLYLDFFPRKGKKPGAWMTGFQDQYKRGDKDYRPHIALVFNLPRPSSAKPSLLNYNELHTLLHEFGHALHGIFSRVRFKSLSGTSVYRDFVELPSQIMENWAGETEWLKKIAIHYETGEVMPDEMIQNIIKSRHFTEAYSGSRQLSFAFLDMAWHSLESEFKGEITEFEEQATLSVSVLPRQKDIAVSTSFSHIFSGGYAAGYYGYKWAEVLDADAFSKFKQEGIFDKKTAKEFREKILSKGGTKHPMELYTDFMGREPSIIALLERCGLINK